MTMNNRDQGPDRDNDDDTQETHFPNTEDPFLALAAANKQSPAGVNVNVSSHVFGDANPAFSVVFKTTSVPLS